MMFGGGVMMLFWLLVVLLVLAIPVVLVVFLTGGGLAWLRTQNVASAALPRRCEECGQALQANWRICPH